MTLETYLEQTKQLNINRGRLDGICQFDADNSRHELTFVNLQNTPEKREAKRKRAWLKRNNKL